MTTGIDTGDQIQVETSLGPKQRVRVAVPIEVEPHPVFRREGADILSFADLTLPQVGQLVMLVLLVLKLAICPLVI